MRVTAIADLHGAVEHLDAVGGECDALLVLGDLINLIDYRSMDGILVEVFGREPVAEAAQLRARGRFDEARSAIRRRVADGGDARERFLDLARRDYERVFAALPAHSFVTHGNADIPELLNATIPPHIRFLDGETVRLGATTIGFVGGGVRTPLAVPAEVDEAQYDAKFDRLGAVDIVCTHMPPRIPWYVYDVVARKFEPGSVGLIGYVQRYQPRFALFGHVHQPLVNRGNIGRTELVNVGHFQGTGRGFSFEVGG